MLTHIFYFILFLISLVLIAIQPWFLMYGYSNIMAFLLHGLIRYRVKVTRENLKAAFPDKSEMELSTIEQLTYKNLADIAVETIKGFTMFNWSVRKQHKIVNPELLDKYYNNRQSVIGVAAHYGNWEWGAMSAGLFLKHKPIAIYKPLDNPIIDWFMRWNRAQRGTVLASIFKTEETFQKYKNEICLYILVADQSPSNLNKSYWVNFFNQDTACLHGPEKYAHLYNYPVIFIEIKRVKRGHYEIILSELAENPSELPESELTKLYMGRVEEMIRKAPENWLWTHRRWKRKRPPLFNNFEFTPKS